VRTFVTMSSVKDFNAHLDGAVLGFAVAISCVSAIAFGLAPALRSNRIDPWTAL
jgi:ABC-type antimicrobial peptide transport system permease subunit